MDEKFWRQRQANDPMTNLQYCPGKLFTEMKILEQNRKTSKVAQSRNWAGAEDVCSFVEQYCNNNIIKNLHLNLKLSL